MKIIYANNLSLTRNVKSTTLADDADAAGSTLTVDSIFGFSTDQILCIGEIGDEKTELIKTHAATSPTGTTITLASALVYDHPQSAKVYIVHWDDAVFAHADTIAGTKTTLSTTDLQVDQEETQYSDSAETAGFYFYRLKNTITGDFSTWSDPLPYDDYADNTVMSIKIRALEEINEHISHLITHSFLDNVLWQARREYHNSPGKRPFRKNYNEDLGDVVTGMYRVAVPSDLQDPYTAKNVFGIRVGTEKNMDSMSKKDFDWEYRDSPHTTVSNAITAADTSITLANTRDFDESGTIKIGDQNITYTANNETTGVLSGVPASGDGAITSDIAADIDVWQNISFGLPRKFHLWDSYIYFDRPIADDYEDQNIWGDYYKTVVEKDSDADTLDELEYDMFVPYLKWKIKKRKDPSLKKENDDDYIEWLQMKANSLRNEHLGEDVFLEPDIDHLE